MFLALDQSIFIKHHLFIQLVFFFALFLRTSLNQIEAKNVF